MNIPDYIQWPGWEVTGLIGSGTAGSVYEIQRNLYGTVEKAALKVLRIPQKPGDIDEMYSDGFTQEAIMVRLNDYREAILQEYNLMAEMKGHANVVYCDDVRQIPHEDGIGWDIFIKMELLRPLGKSLGPTIPDEQVIDIGIDICNALVLCKQLNIVHRDVKPQNIFISRDGTYKLGDFGIAKTSEHTTFGTKAGTYRYMAPEVHNAQPYGIAADQYSLGLVLYWMLNERRPPFSPLPPDVPTVSQDEAARTRRFEGEPIPPPAHGSPALQAIVLKALAFDPADRFAGPDEMLEALRMLKAGEDPGVIVPVGGKKASVPVEEPPAVPVVVTEPKTGGRKSKAKRTMDDYSRRKRASAIFGGSTLGLMLLAAVIAILAGKPKAPAPAVPSEVSTGPRETVSETVAPPLLADWSGWTDELPAYINDEDYAVILRPMFSARTMEIAQSGQDTMAGWELFDTVDGNGAWGVWSPWSQLWIQGSPTRQVETAARYRYRDKETTTSSLSSLVGWTLDETSYTYGEFGEWSPWSQEQPASSDTREVRSQTLYRYRDKETTTSDSSALAGWTLDEAATDANAGTWSRWSSTPVSEDSGVEVQTKTQYKYRDVTRSYTYSDWSGWSKWQSKEVEENDQTEVKTREVLVTRYKLGHYCAADGAEAGSLFRGTSPTSFSGAEYHELGWFKDLSDFTAEGTVGGFTAYKSTRCANSRRIWYVIETEEKTVTQYRYRTREREETVSYGEWSSWSDKTQSPSETREVKTRTRYRWREIPAHITYYFYRWMDWSDWSESAVSSSGDREVETTQRYSYRDRERTPLYRFSRWTSWSDWSEEKVYPSDVRKVETTTFYRSRDQLDETTYFFRRWNAWSPYADSPQEENETTEVRERTLYQYRSRGTGEDEAGSGAPSIIVSNAVQTGQVTLSWEPVPGAAGYLVFRADSESEPYQTAAASDTPGFTDMNSEAGRTYLYLVCSVGADGTTGPFSAVTPGTCMLTQPEVKGSHSSAGKNLLTWTAVDEAAYYQVYRSDSENGDYILLKTTTKLNFTNTESEKDKVYYYKVRAVASDSDIVSAFSEPVELTAKE